MTADITAQDVAEEIRRRCVASEQPVTAYWIAVSGKRDEYADRLNGILKGFPAVAVVVRQPRFDNPNSVFDDLATVIRDHREVIEKELLRCEPSDRCAVALVARSELHVSQASSPVPLPEWFPVAGGRTVTSVIEDLTSTTAKSLAASELQVSGLSNLLLELDLALVRRLQDQRGERRAMQSLFDQLKEGDERPGEFLDAAAKELRKVPNPSSYRPSQSRRNSLVSRLWSRVQSEKPDGLSATIKALQSALGLPPELDVEWHQTLMAVVGRPTNRDANEGAQFLRNVLLTLSASAQLITASAHAGEYTSYPIPLLRASSYDLRKGLMDALSVINSL
jgi:hypothetical protein